MAALARAVAVLDDLGAPLDPAENVQLEMVASDLQFLWSEFEVPAKVQAALGTAGYRAVATFGVLGDDRAGVRAALAADFSLDPALAGLSGPQAILARVTQTKVLAAWLAASVRATEETKQAADHRALRLPMVLPRSSLVSLRARYEVDFGRVSDFIWPCASMVERLLEEVEDGRVGVRHSVGRSL